MAGGVQRDDVRKRRADVCDAQLVDEELSELEDAGKFRDRAAARITLSSAASDSGRAHREHDA